MSSTLLVTIVLLMGASIRCNTDHEQLAQRPGSGGMAGAGGTGSGGLGGGATVTGPTSTQGSSTTGAGGTMHYTPDGEDVLSLVHGQVDAERIAFCVGRAADEGAARFDGPPVPAGGLGYGESFTLSEIEELDFENDDLELIVLAGEFDAAADCDATLEDAYWTGRVQEPRPGSGGAAGAAGADTGAAGAGGEGVAQRPPTRAMLLPTIPANSLVLGRHYIMVLAGCMGGPGVIDDGVHCGPNHSSETPSLRPVLVPVSRDVEPGRLSLQVMHASPATADATFESVPVEGAPGVHAIFGTELRFGSIFPKDPNVSQSSESLGIPHAAEIVVSSRHTPFFRKSWTEVAGPTEIADGRSYLLILLGPSLGTDSAEGFNESRVTLLATGSGTQE